MPCRRPATTSRARALVQTHAALTTPQRAAKEQVLPPLRNASPFFHSFYYLSNELFSQILSICNRRRPGLSTYQADIDSALKQLLTEPSPGGGTATLALGQGTWEVSSLLAFTTSHQARIKLRRVSKRSILAGFQCTAHYSPLSGPWHRVQPHSLHSRWGYDHQQRSLQQLSPEGGMAQRLGQLDGFRP